MLTTGFMLPIAAFLEPGQLALMIPIVAIMIPIVALLTKHQQRMAELVHGSQANSSSVEVMQLREEVRRLRDDVSQLTLIVESQNRGLPNGTTDEIKNRIGLGY